jgi:hypothetical protein
LEPVLLFTDRYHAEETFALRHAVDGGNDVNVTQRMIGGHA